MAHLMQISQLQVVITQIITMKKVDLQYSIGDLSRALLREFLSQKGLKNTLQAFEKEDANNKKKINKNLLIEMLSLKNLVLLNRQSRDTQTSLLQILVSYLNKKYQVKKNNFVTTQPNASFPKLLDTAQGPKPEPLNKAKQRPVSSKPLKSYELESAKHSTAPLLEKEELKVIYQKLTKKEDTKEFRIVESNALKKGEPSKIDEKPAHLEQQSCIEPKKNNPTQVQDEYNQQFQPADIKQTFRAEKSQIKKNETPANSNSKNSQVPKIAELPISEKVKDLKPQSTPVQNFKQASTPVLQIEEIHKQEVPKAKKINELNVKQTNRQQKKQAKLLKGISEQNLNPLPILHIQSRPLQIQKKQVKKSMGSSASDEKKEEEKIEPPKQQPQAPQKNRTQMRLVGKKRQPSSKNIEVQQEKKQKTQDPIIQQPKKQPVPVQVQKHNLSSNEAIASKKQIDSSKKVETPSSTAAPVMVTIGKKRKTKQEPTEANYPTKFKFDENFTHEIPKQIVYQYKEYHFEPITINQNAAQLYPDVIVNPAINYKQKGGGVQPIKKKIQKIIASKDAERLKKVVFQSSPAVLPKSWTQGFILSPHQQTPYGLKQIEGGPCGIIAALQCYFLKHLFLCSKQSEYNDDILREVCLVAAITNMLWKVKSTDKFFLAFPPKGASKVQISNLRTVTLDANDFMVAFAGVWSVRDEYIGNTNHGVAALLYSIVLTKGIDLIQEEMDIKENPLIGNHGHCTQQFVNLLLTGKAASNCFDGVKILDDYKLKGIQNKSQFGFLTIFEALKYLQVGKNLKNPIFPAWVICKQFHYHVIFAPHYLISQNNKSPKFDIVYFDGLYNCGDRIRLTLEPLKQDEQDNVKLKDLPLIEQVMMTKWGRKVANWNGSTKIL